MNSVVNDVKPLLDFFSDFVFPFVLWILMEVRVFRKSQVHHGTRLTRIETVLKLEPLEEPDAV